MAFPIYCDPTKRHDFLYLIDIVNGNPNGDPDAGNSPRIDPETMRGLITDVCIKRKVRDYIQQVMGEQDLYRIYVQADGVALNAKHEEAHRAVFPEEQSNGKKGPNERANDRQEERRRWMCEQFYDVRAFGAVMSTGDYPAGQVRGPIQLTFAQSLDPIAPQDISITRCAVANVDPTSGTTTTMGRKSFVPYGLYRGYGFYSPAYAAKTGFSAEDLALFWDAFRELWDLDHAAGRAMLSIQGLWVFTHDRPRGNAPAHQLFDRLQAQLANGILVPRHVRDYQIELADQELPDGVTVTRLV